VIDKRFYLVRSVKEKYGILDNGTYNFDETGFQMGAIRSHKVVTGSQRRGKRKVVQPGNREWVTVIQGICAAGWAIPLFIIFAGKKLLSKWFHDKPTPGDRVIAVSDNGWITNELGVKWLEHFNTHTKSRTVGAYRLLIIDSHESHNSFEFQKICEEKIITLCMPAHSSHLLQPPDVGWFPPLKTAYSEQIRVSAKNEVHKIDKRDFLSAFTKVFKEIFKQKNVEASFQGAGLVPFDPERVLKKLNVRRKTPPLRATVPTKWESKTPSNAQELQSQSTLIRNRIQRHQDSSPTSIIESLDRLQKGSVAAMHRGVTTVGTRWPSRGS